LNPILAALSSSAPPPSLLESEAASYACMIVALACAAFASTLRIALRRSHPHRVLALVRSPERRAELAPRLERVDPLAMSAAILQLLFVVAFVGLMLSSIAKDGPLEGRALGIAFIIGAPLVLLLTEIIPAEIARAHGDRLLISLLGPFSALTRLLFPIVKALELVQRSFQRILGVPDQDVATRRIVEGLRKVIEEAEITDDLSDVEIEMIGNVMDFRHVDVAAVMTPRTEIHAVDVEEDMATVMGAFATAGHSRIPVYKDSIDNIIGTVSALEVTKAAADGSIETTDLRGILRPAFLVPETKRVSELLAEFRQKKQKMAIVLDEYGGTAGMVTLGDVTAEVVGDVQDEYEEENEDIRVLEGGNAEIQAGVHVSEVNEALDLGIPEEEDFETLGGFVLAELGHFPRRGESFRRGEVSYKVLEASDRRVLKVSISRSA